MDKKTLRISGIAFLISSLLTGSFAIFGQGNVPIPGVTISSLFGSSTTDSLTNQYRDQVSALQTENDTLKKENEDLRKQIGQDNQETTSQAEDDTQETTSVQEEPAQTGSFTISEGQTSSEIADALVSAGYLTNADELVNLISQWNLDNLIIADTYELSSDMTVHQIAELITNGQYYYIP